MKYSTSAAFCWGAFFSTGVSMFIQDFMGLEGYIELLRNNWWNLSPAVGLTIALFCAWRLYLLVTKEAKEAKEAKERAIALQMKAPK